MSERSYFPRGLSDIQGDVENSDIYFGIPLPSSSLHCASVDGIARHARGCSVSNFATNADVSAPARGYGGLVYGFRTRALRNFCGAAASAMLSLEPIFPSQSYGPMLSPVASHKDSDWLLSMLAHFASAKSQVPCFPLRVEEHDRVFPPPWKSASIDDSNLSFIFDEA
jgi:hypothetical protein